MLSIINRSNIEEIIQKAKVHELVDCMEQAFTAYSSGTSVVPPVGTMTFQSPPGDVHIKYGYIKDDPYYVIKIASGFYDNPSVGLSSSNGLNLVFDQKTGLLETILLDEGYLTDVRTGLAGAVVARHLAPEKVDAIGIVGCGTQARMQLHFLKPIVKCKKVLVWGRSEDKLKAYQNDMAKEELDIETTTDPKQISRQCQLIVTTTPATEPLLFADDLQPNVLITAVGADTKGKQELDPAILQKADLIVMDSRSQCQEHGEIHKAFQAHLLDHQKNMIELGEMIASKRTVHSKNGITVADLTGIATQDIQISKFVLEEKRRNMAYRR